MASITKHKGRWRAQVARKGVRKSRIFATKREAQDWASRQEYLILNGDKAAARERLALLMDRYAREVSPKKRGARWEQLRLEKLQRDPIAQKRLGDLAPKDFAEWRDRRLQEVTSGTVRREMELLSAVLRIARREWGLLSHDPLEGVRRPPNNKPRDRLATDDEMQRLAHVAGSDPAKATARAFMAFRFSCETAMRAGEVVGLTWDRVDLQKRVARLDETKNGTSRSVPLSSAAVAILEGLQGVDPVLCFALSSAQLDALYRKIRAKAGVEGLRYHDSRAVGCLKLSKHLDVLDLAKATGHRDLRILIDTYYRETAEEIAKRLP